jgi:hypothetical protein
VFRSVAFAEGIVSAVCADCFELLCLGFRDVDKWVKESGEYYDPCVVFYRCAEADDINLSKTGIDFANEVCLGEVRVRVKDLV